MLQTFLQSCCAAYGAQSQDQATEPTSRGILKRRKNSNQATSNTDNSSITNWEFDEFNYIGEALRDDILDPLGNDVVELRRTISKTFLDDTTDGTVKTSDQTLNSGTTRSAVSNSSTEKAGNKNGKSSMKTGNMKLGLRKEKKSKKSKNKTSNKAIKDGYTLVKVNSRTKMDSSFNLNQTHGLTKQRSFTTLSDVKKSKQARRSSFTKHMQRGIKSRN
ncbi:predicted protein [Chaetoceros tenuissimus]|uniref:Uncharacterized protein n=1 Tax=Chaetoceros tenuissimus TaxID=426638 RepID=A0AAD3CKP4_9STRA|nr:predicted protein [Chaetoceros tenuissimus]